MTVDVLDAKIVRLFNDVPRISVLEASRVLKVARATVQARLERMLASGVIGSWVPQPDPAQLGFPVVAFCSLTISQDLGHDAVVEALGAWVNNRGPLFLKRRKNNLALVGVAGRIGVWIVAPRTVFLMNQRLRVW
ncbi:Lrp/AsnC family transcriptional regulator, partial [Paenarthrobacter sp. Z7-10]|uniref:Lrp/AsnC family transcriptional regulator n=1 Tax=Paenarthrobacter sp. Z7-10 TaxID=2787635 RepID=UPI002E783024